MWGGSQRMDEWLHKKKIPSMNLRWNSKKIDIRELGLPRSIGLIEEDEKTYFYKGKLDGKEVMIRFDLSPDGQSRVSFYEIEKSVKVGDKSREILERHLAQGSRIVRSERVSPAFYSFTLEDEKGGRIGLLVNARDVEDMKEKLMIQGEGKYGESTYEDFLTIKEKERKFGQRVEESWKEESILGQLSGREDSRGQDAMTYQHSFSGNNFNLGNSFDLRQSDKEREGAFQQQSQGSFQLGNLNLQGSYERDVDKERERQSELYFW